MKKMKQCVSCKETFTYLKLEEKASNGAYKKYYENGVLIVSFKNCYSCFRDTFKTKDGSKKKKDSCVKYEKTLKGHLMRTYRNMKSRVLGIQKKKAHLYQGMELLSKDEFYEWSLGDDIYNALYHHWKENDFDRKLTPSIDRIDSSKGYVLSNMRWLTHSENSRLGSLSQARKRQQKESC